MKRLIGVILSLIIVISCTTPISVSAEDDDVYITSSYSWSVPANFKLIEKSYYSSKETIDTKKFDGFYCIFNVFNNRDITVTLCVDDTIVNGGVLQTSNSTIRRLIVPYSFNIYNYGTDLFYEKYSDALNWIDTDYIVCDSSGSFVEFREEISYNTNSYLRYYGDGTTAYIGGIYAASHSWVLRPLIDKSQYKFHIFGKDISVDESVFDLPELQLDYKTDYNKTRVLELEEENERLKASITNTNSFGDINGDNLVDVADAQMILNYYVYTLVASDPETLEEWISKQ